MPELRLVLVTPETTLLDEPVRGLRLPMFDGQAGILPGRAPMVGRLGTGELSVELSDGGTESFFVDGGFVQVKGEVVSVLTDRALEPSKIELAEADAGLSEAVGRTTTSDEESDARFRDQERYRGMRAVAKKAK
ncbi:MAG: F0F1 ATP synthase subunit epsilon [Planctomycetota bacterium]